MTMLRVQAVEYPPASGTYVDISNSTAYNARFLRASDLSTAGAPASTAVAGGVSLTSSVGIINRALPIYLFRDDASVDVDDWNTNVKKWFNPANQRSGPQFLKVRWEDEATDLRIPFYVQSAAPDGQAKHAYRVNLYCLLPYFEALTASTSTSSGGADSITNNGNTHAPATITVSGSAVSGDRYTVTDNTGRGLRNHPIALTSAASGKTPSQCFVWVNGRPAAFQMGNGGASTQTFIALVSMVANGTAIVDIAYDTGVTNPLADTLDLGPGLPFRSTSNSQMLWFEMRVDGAPQDRNGVWYPARLNLFNSDMSALSFTMSDESTDQTKITLNTSGAGDSANAIVCDLGVDAETTDALTGLERITASHTADVISYVAYQKANSDRWIIAWSSASDGTVTTAIDLGNSSGTAVRLAIGIEPTGVAPTDGASLTVSPATTFVDVDFDTSKDPDVVRATKEFALLDGTVENSTTSQVITLDSFIYPGSTLVLNTTAYYQDRKLTLEAAGSTSGSVTFSDNQDLLTLAPGANVIAEAVNGNVQIDHRDAYS